MANKYWFGKGKIGLYERNPTTGAVGKGLYLGNCPELKVTFNSDVVDHFESESGHNSLDRQVVKSNSAEVSLTLESLTPENLALLTSGVVQTLAALTAQSYFFPSGIVAGENYIIPSGFNLANAVVKDSAVTPVTVTTTKYALDASFGSMNFIDVTGYTQPFELEYDRGAATNVPFMSGDRPVRFLRFEGINLGNPGSAQTKCLVELYNSVYQPVSDLSLITDDFGKFELKGAALVDDTRASDSAFGQFGRMIYL